MLHFVLIAVYLQALLKLTFPLYAPLEVLLILNFFKRKELNRSVAYHYIHGPVIRTSSLMVVVVLLVDVVMLLIAR